MKRKVQHPAPSQSEQNGPKYWRSLDELASTPGFQEHLERERHGVDDEMMRRHHQDVFLWGQPQ